MIIRTILSIGAIIWSACTPGYFGFLLGIGSLWAIWDS